MNKQDIVKNLSIMIPKSEKPFLLFSGPSGTGKTWSAEMLAKELGYKIIDSFTDLEQMSNIYDPQPILVMLDELQGKNRAFQELVLEKMNQIEKNKGKYKAFDPNERVVSVKNIIVVICTTDKHKILDPIVRRCTIIDYPEYDKNEIKDIVKSTFKKVAENIVQSIVDSCKLNVRAALSMAEQYMIFKDLDKVREIRCINKFGLTRNEEKYLLYLSSRGTMSVDAITSILSLPSKQEVVMEIEPYFKKMGWVDTQSKGRKLTKQGQDFVSQLQNTFEVV
jgi:Holliday junction resolvasome RuvABC ATP-dependent DNA helicase subunit